MKSRRSCVLKIEVFGKLEKTFNFIFEMNEGAIPLVFVANEIFTREGRVEGLVGDSSFESCISQLRCENRGFPTRRRCRRRRRERREYREPCFFLLGNDLYASHASPPTHTSDTITRSIKSCHYEKWRAFLTRYVSETNRLREVFLLVRRVRTSIKTNARLRDIHGRVHVCESVKSKERNT